MSDANFLWQRTVERAIGANQGTRWTARGRTGWGEAWLLEAHDVRLFVKTATGARADMLDAEADGLRALAGTRTIRVPAVVANGIEDGTRFLALEWLEMRGSRKGAALGATLAALHRSPTPRGPVNERFGWRRSNWIGGTPQENTWSDDWCAFFRDRRLAPQLALAAKHAHARKLKRDGERLLDGLRALLRGHDAPPSLLHGDLWSGNAAMLASGEPVVFDPAVYVGDREADLAMTELFGGFEREFYDAYNDAWRVESGYPVRRELYNLYHVLNHLNLFGDAYLAQAERTVSALLSETR